MIFGVDVSRYQPASVIPGWGFVILNCDDPGVLEKITAARVAAVPWGLYKWVYPGADLAADLRALLGRGLGDPPLGYWADYEQAGVELYQLSQWFAEGDAQGLKSGYYSVAGGLDHGPFLDRAWWAAQYPWPNDGTFPGADRLRASRDAQLWQYTSTNGTLDQNVVLDEVWYANFLSGSVAPPDPPKPAPREVTLMETFKLTEPDGSGLSWNIVWVGVDGNLYHERFQPGAWSPIVARATGLDPYYPLKIDRDWDSSVQILGRSHDGTSLVHVYVTPDAAWHVEYYPVASGPLVDAAYARVDAIALAKAITVAEGGETAPPPPPPVDLTPVREAVAQLQAALAAIPS